MPYDVGTPALTTLGFGPAEMDEVAAVISETLSSTTPASASSGPSKVRYQLDAGTAGAGRRRAAELLQRFPLYPQLSL